ncbi:tRNA (guanine(46)-N(7))-methyltransferase TrmB [Leptospira idonii]|uniref:tRNA (guanine-N(7)-)-methyltransferase n=1 Tax=Leptospira idonii TaxID=1193500 RepID=A0A4V6QMW4_9LEPT|nr:methyltransferase [Leptospira idonii]TGN18926.1 tRNA (guanine-N(7)-)-methyltransferase [Leptospira idonii]
MLVNPQVQEKLWKFALRTPYHTDYLLHPKEWGKKIDLKKSFPDYIENYWLEMGSGWGEVAIELASKHPKTGFLLMEKKIDRIVATETKRKALGLENIRYMTLNFQWFFTEVLEKEIFDTVLINFPDPWPKRKHHKNRLMQPDMLADIHSLLKPNGNILFATDYGPYARRCISLFRKIKGYEWEGLEYSFARNESLPLSFFETEKQKEGKRIYYLERKKVDMI